MIVDPKDAICHGAISKGGAGTSTCVEHQVTLALSNTEVLATNLMEQICHKANLDQAYKRVKANKGSPGVDGMTIHEMGTWIRKNKEQLVSSLLAGSYQPQPVKRVEIPKPGKRNETRMLGIPTVIDRLIQQAIAQILDPIFDPGFSESSFGFRRGRGAHGALKKASEYVRAGYIWCVDTDIEKFFDCVNHDILMSRLASKIGDKRLLKILRRFLQAGIMQDGVCTERYEGTPQGGPLSPLLSNILLDEVDKELEKRGHKFCRYADDQNIYVRSKRAGERVFQSMKRFLETRLKLKVNAQKSAVALVRERKFLGYKVCLDGHLAIAPETKQRVEDKIRKLSWRSRGVELENVIKQLNQYLKGWLQYYQLCTSRSLWRELDSWIRRRLRCYKLVQKKRPRTVVTFLKSRGVSDIEARQIGSSGKGWWRLSRTRAVHRALDNAWFKDQGLMSLETEWDRLLKA